MEYRRRRRSRRSSASRGGSSGSGAAKTVAALLVIAAIVYVVSASAVGTWIAENVIAPAFSAFDNLVQGSARTPMPVTTDEPGAISMPQEARGGDTVTGDVELAAMECFALQMGVFGDISNAEKEAAALQQRGAGGYILEDEGKYRVLAAVYLAQESLTQVREQLTVEGMDSANYVFSAPNSTLRVTAPQQQLDAISAGFDALAKLLQDISEATLLFDQQQQTPDAGRQRAAELLSSLQEAETAFLAAATMEHPILDAAKTCFQSCKEALATLAEYPAQSFVDFSSKMKYTNIYIVRAYATLAEAVSSL